jgi:hypothetical protein
MDRVRGWERGSGGETPSLGMRARLLGWPGQVGIIFERKRFFERTLFKQKISYIYTAYFSFEFSFEIRFFFERTAFERKPKIRKVRKNGIQKKKMNFERTLFDQTTSSPIVMCRWLKCKHFKKIFFSSWQFR